MTALDQMKLDATDLHDLGGIGKSLQRILDYIEANAASLIDMRENGARIYEVVDFAVSMA